MPKIPRWRNREHIIITEKLDGTNASIHINDDCSDFRVASRNRWISPDSDNYGFATWCNNNKDRLLNLGPGSHFGEWWGHGIQRQYNLTEKRFSLFNVLRWATPEQEQRLKDAGVDTVPILYKGPFTDTAVEETMSSLMDNGSVAVPTYRNPEGIVIFYPSARTLYKLTQDDNHKGIKEAA